MRLSFAVVVSISAGGFAGAPGAPFGQSGNDGCPGAGSQAGFCANRAAAERTALTSRRCFMRAGYHRLPPDRIIRFRMHESNDAWQGVRSFARFYGRLTLAHFLSYVVVGGVSYMLI